MIKGQRINLHIDKKCEYMQDIDNVSYLLKWVSDTQSEYNAFKLQIRKVKPLFSQKGLAIS